MTRLGSVG